MADFMAVAEQFVAHYYTTFDTNRGALASLYRENSMLTFESSQSLGAASIGEKLTTLPFQKVQHKVATQDAQPTLEGGALILVTGALIVDDNEHPLNYTQVFHLSRDPAGQWFVLHDLFKLVMH